jgi:hypothetical protein
MSWLVVTKWDRRDAASREDFGTCALRLCQATKGRGAVTSSRFYWSNPDQVAVVNHTDDLSAYWSAPGEALGAALFAMADVATMAAQEQWADARQGTATYREAGREV